MKEMMVENDVVSEGDRRGIKGDGEEGYDSYDKSL